MLMSTTIRLFIPVVCIAFCVSCSTPRPAYSPNLSLAQEPARQEATTLTESLFEFKEATLSEAAIQQILASEIELPSDARLALLSYGSTSSYNYRYNFRNTEGYMKLQQEYIDILETKLEDTERLEKIILMPKLLIGSKPTIFTLREAAVRLQADLLLVFSVNSDVYYDYKFLKKNEVKAFATCEALLLDIKTGIIPFSEVVTRDTLLIKQDPNQLDDLFKKRAENQAIKMTLTEIGKRLHNYLK